ncbi:MAG: hypothetical protein KGJ04_03520 [Gammaproteobacteria bacterium]|nr:hypothetical protein [Gammaproteobacteria bacterium]
MTLQSVWGPLAASSGLDATALRAVCANLMEIEGKLNSSTQPLQALRSELMDSLDRQVLNSEILNLPEDLRARLRQQQDAVLQNDAEARAYLAANALRIEVLREYAHRRFGDRADGDWFAVYARAAHLRQRNTRNYIERVLGGTRNAGDDVRFQAMTLKDSEIRARLLQVPAGTHFPGFGKADGQTA